MSDPYNPLAEEHLARQVADAVERQPLLPVPPPERFPGAGLYAFYYVGDNPLYTALRDSAAPIYVGKAALGASRIGIGASTTERKLYGRIAKHSRSINAGAGLALDDFRCRALVTNDVWIVLGESGLISTYRPLWNVVIDGFGNNDPGSGRYAGRVSAWDTLHPGRAWVEKLEEPNERTRGELEQLVAEHLADPDATPLVSPVEVDPGPDTDEDDDLKDA
ncbi:MAG: Eco29kI family restriction endonuclease [Euzebyales bacterium]|jgi:hypothetical protein|nr:Eco29kI family restriction endonuclease [Euzebyales bacterium]